MEAESLLGRPKRWLFLPCMGSLDHVIDVGWALESTNNSYEDNEVLSHKEKENQRGEREVGREGFTGTDFPSVPLWRTVSTLQQKKEAPRDPL